MTLSKSSFEYIKEMIKNNESITGLKAFCNGSGMDFENHSSPVYISNDKVCLRYRRNNYYITYSNSRIDGTTYFNKI
tara:strand:- start:2 stop:232 length:231 start_codon:yes stop_codon:yes gene_type:complete